MALSPQDQSAIRRVITAQLDAFQADDGLQAFHYAAPAIRQQFRTVANFMAMVRSAYPAIYRPRGVIFAALGTLHGMPAQTVLLMGPDGQVVKAIYLMQQQASGDWRIAGCLTQPVEPEPQP